MVTTSNEQIRRLDLALAELEECPRTDECVLLHEHVYAAKVALLGAMHDEYDMNLELARKAVDNLPSKELKDSVGGLLGPLSRPNETRA